MENTEKTLDYYNQNASLFINDTFDVDLHPIHDRFLSYLKEGDKILDLGSGSGRDTKYFLSKGFSVEAVDGSIELCKIAEKNTGIKVRNILFSELDYKATFDGIWACASLLHIPSAELTTTVDKAFKALKQDGVFYLSFKYGDFEGERNGRYYTDLTEESFTSLLSSLSCKTEILESFLTDDARKERSDRWLNVIVKKQ